MIKVLVINTLAIDYNGVTDCILQYLKAMDKKNMQIDILSTVSLNSELEKKFLRLGCTIIQLENRKQNPIMYVWKLAGLVRREKYNIVHAHGNSATLTFDMLGAFLGKCKVRIAHGHSTQCGSKLVDMLLRPFFYKLYTCGISCGKDVGDWLFKRHKFQILPNGRELSLYKYNVKNRQEIRVKYNLGNSLVIGHIGRFNKPKNQEFVLEIFMELQKLQKNAKLLLVGDGILFGNIQNCEIKGLRNMLFSQEVLEIYQKFYPQWMLWSFLACMKECRLLFWSGRHRGCLVLYQIVLQENVK